MTLTPHSEKHNTWRPSGAHSARRRPSVPASIWAVHSSSRMQYRYTRPSLAHAAKTYSESGDQAICVITMLSASRPGLIGRCGAIATTAAEGDGKEGTCHDRETWNVSARRTTRRSATAVRMKCAPGLKATRLPDCL